MQTITVRRWCALAMVAVLMVFVAACSEAAKSPATKGSASDVPTDRSSVAVKRPGAFKPPIYSPDILVSSQDPLPASVVAAARALPGVVASVQFSMATFYVEEQAVTYAAVDPAQFRRFTPIGTAKAADVWDRVADGEIAIVPALRDQLPIKDDSVVMGNDADAEKVHLGALAPLVERSRIGAVVNERWAPKLGMPEGNALIVSTGNAAPGPVQQALAGLVGKRGSAQILAVNLDIHAAQTAVLTGGSVARAVGSFTYTVNPDGSVNPDTAWIREYIRTEQVPILGAVRCNKAMLPQLRAALTDIVRAHLASSIHPQEYGGCFVPRFIASDPSKGLSFHTWGTAIDLNVPGNQRGTAGLMDRRIVDIFKRWGFNWGGNWAYTDPMHFEMARIVAVR